MFSGWWLLKKKENEKEIYGMSAAESNSITISPEV